MTKPFDNISEKNIKKLLYTLEGHTFNYVKGDQILRAFKSDNIIGIILDGDAEIIRNDYRGNKVKIEELTNDDIFGTQISSMNNKEYEIIAKTNVKVIIIDYKQLLNRNNLDKSYYNEFILNMLSIINDKLQEKNERIRILSNKTIRNKLLEYFSIQRNKNHSKNIYLPHNFTDLANYLSIDRSAMTRELKFMKDEGFIEIKGKKILILYNEDL